MRQHRTCAVLRNLVGLPNLDSEPTKPSRPTKPLSKEIDQRMLMQNMHPEDRRWTRSEMLCSIRARSACARQASPPPSTADPLHKRCSAEVGPSQGSYSSTPARPACARQDSHPDTLNPEPYFSGIHEQGPCFSWIHDHGSLKMLRSFLVNPES